MYIKCMHDTLLLDAVYKINIEVAASIGDADRPDAHAIKTDYNSVSFYPGRIGSRGKGPSFSAKLQLDCSVRGGNNSNHAGYTTRNRHNYLQLCLL
jgi:hypothetical protein